LAKIFGDGDGGQPPSTPRKPAPGLSWLEDAYSWRSCPVFSMGDFDS